MNILLGGHDRSEATRGHVIGPGAYLSATSLGVYHQDARGCSSTSETEQAHDFDKQPKTKRERSLDGQHHTNCVECVAVCQLNVWLGYDIVRSSVCPFAYQKSHLPRTGQILELAPSLAPAPAQPDLGSGVAGCRVALFAFFSSCQPRCVCLQTTPEKQGFHFAASSCM